MPSSSEIRVTPCLCGWLIRLLRSALTASLYLRSGNVLKPQGVRMRGVTSFLNPGESGPSNIKIQKTVAEEI
jgi:hypothetical protein